MNPLVLLLAFLLGVFIKVYDEILDEPSLRPYSTPPILNGLIGGIVVTGISTMLYDPTILPFIGISLPAMYLGDTVFYNSHVPYEHKSLDDGVWIKGLGVTAGLLLLMYLKDPWALNVLMEPTIKNGIWYMLLIGGFVAIIVEGWCFPEESSTFKTSSRIFGAICCAVALPITLFFNNLFYDSISLCLAASLGMILVSVISKLLIVKNRDPSDPRNQSFIVNTISELHLIPSIPETFLDQPTTASPSAIPEEQAPSHTLEASETPSPFLPAHMSQPS
jgi:hypothetical protein